jgi:hypothetical protein
VILSKKVAQTTLPQPCYVSYSNSALEIIVVGHAVAKWLRHCAANWKVAGSIPDEVNF